MMELIPSKQIVLPQLDKSSTLNERTLSYQRKSSSINHGLSRKRHHPENRNYSLNISGFSVVDLIKNNIYNSDIALLFKYWRQWKSAVNINNVSKIIKSKDITFDHIGINSGFLNGNSFIAMLDSMHSMRERKHSIDKHSSYKNKTFNKDGDLSIKCLQLQVCSDKKNYKHCNQEIIRHYWDIWKNYVRGRNIVSKIDGFLNVVSAEKKKTVERYQEKSTAALPKENRIKVGKIINNTLDRDSRKEGQHAKRLNKTSSSNKGFSDQMIRSLSEKNISASSLKVEVETSLKRAHSLLENTIKKSLSNNPARRKNFNYLIKKGSLMPLEFSESDILNRMKTREIERRERWQKLKERRKILEAEKERRILEEEQEVLREKELRKNLELEEQRKKRRQDKEKMLKLKLLKQKKMELNLKAEAHYKRRLLLMGISVFHKAIAMRNGFILQANLLYQKRILSKIFLKLRNHCYLMKERQMSLAVCFHRKNILRVYFDKWKKFQMELISCSQAAIDFYEMRVQENVLLSWHRLTSDMIIEENVKLELAEIHYRKGLLKSCFFSWKTLPSIVKVEKARDKIKDNLRQKVLEVIPDFSPSLVDNELNCSF